MSETRSESGVTDEEEVLLCLHCFEPLHPQLYYCPHCGATVGTQTPTAPYLGIRMTNSFETGMWNKINDPGAGAPIRLISLLLILFFYPIMLVGWPFSLLDYWRPQIPEPGDKSNGHGPPPS